MGTAHLLGIIENSEKGGFCFINGIKFIIG